MKRNWMKVILAGTAVLAVLTGCGNSTKDTDGTIPTSGATETAAPTQAENVAATETPAATESPVPTEGAAQEETVVTLGEYKGLVLYEVESEAVAEEMQAILESYGEYIAVERTAIEGDAVNINYVGKKDGVAFEGGTDDSEEGHDLVLGSDSFIDGFEDGLIGTSAGQVIDLNLTFPEDYGNEELAGQAVVFTVTVNAVKEWTVPELTDDFASEQYGYGTAAELIIALYDSMNQESFYEQISNQLMESSKVENLPADRLAEDKQSIIDYYTSYAEYYGTYYGMDTEMALMYFFGIESLETLEAFAEEYAAEQLKNQLVLTEIFNKELSEDAYQARRQQYIEWSGVDEESFLAQYGGEEEVRWQIQAELVMEYIIEQATIVEAKGDVNIEELQ